MYTIEQAGRILALFCSLQSGSYQYEKNMDCIDYMVNCVVVANSVVTVHQVKHCEDHFKRGDRYGSK